MYQKFDFIIIGAGAAGCVLAKRLVDTKKFSILLVEAGPKDKHPFIHIPSGYALLSPLAYNWGYETLPQKNFNNRKIWFPQGCVLGGSSSINGQVYTRGNRWDYNNWSISGCTGWSYKEILPYFRKSEDNNRIRNEYHGQDGPLKISDNIPHKLTEAFVNSAQQVGIPFNSDFNGAKQEGCGFHQVTNRNGKRSSAAVCYLKSTHKEKKFKLLTNALVTKIEIKNGRATSILVKEGNLESKFEVGKELLLSAGAIGSPKILMLSGIGPANELKWLGINSVIDSPYIGKNLQDHVDVFCMSECTGNFSFDKYKSWYMKGLAGIEYLLYGTGIIRSNICEGGAFFNVNDNEPAPDVQFNFLPATASEFGVNMKKIKNGVALNTCIVRPRSRGEVKLSSNNPLAKPLIDPNYWSDEYDINSSVKAIKVAREILQQKPFKSFIKSEIMPGNKCTLDEEIKEYARQYAKNDYHPVGTCRMGAEDDPTSVVMSDLRLKEVENLRVCDSSVMPYIISSNTYAATIMIAEKASDIICKNYS